MNREFLKQVARDNWHLLLVVGAISCIAAYRTIGGPGGLAAHSAMAVPTGRAERAAAPAIDIAAEEREAQREETLAKIRENEAALAANTEPEKASAYVNGIGNMYYQRLQDYAKAATYYERVISDYPDAPALYQTFVQLALCYERLNDQDKRKQTLRRMMESFPKDSQEYAYAYLELYNEAPPKEENAPEGIAQETETADGELLAQAG